MISQVSHSTEEGRNNPREKRKRAKYVAKACNDCKRRKIKCNGQQPCERCRRLTLGCEYAPDNVNSDSQNIEKLLQQVQTLQSQVESLSARRSPVASLPRLGSSAGQIPGVGAHGSSGSPSSSQSLSFHGPTTSTFDFGIARKSLRDRGITEPERPGDITQEPSPVPSPPLSFHHHHDGPPLPWFLSSAEPFWAIGREEAIRLCKVYEAEMGVMYPVLELESNIGQVNALYDHLGLLSSSRASPLTAPTLNNDDINILKLVFACALTAEEGGRSELGLRIFRGVRDALTDSFWRPADIQKTTLLTLGSIFLFQIDEETLAWRTVGTAQRMCMEMGLHRADIYSQPSIVAIGREKVSRLFWSVYSLDVRWSMGTGTPNHLDFMDIDPSLLRPTGEPYLNAMIGYCRIAQKVWRFITLSNNSNYATQIEEMAYLDWQAMQWYNSVPEHLKLPNDPESITSSPVSYQDRSVWRLKNLLHLRGNMMRILIRRPILLKAEHIATYHTEASTAVDIARASIRLITNLNRVSDIYRLQQVVFNWFLVSALAVLFLAVAHAPAQFSSSCKDEFYMALELVEGFSMKSYASRRLWKSIKSLRRLAPQMGLGSQRPVPAPDLQDAAPSVHAMNLPEPVVIPDATDDRELHDYSQVDGLQMCRELMDMFEAMGEPGNVDGGESFFNAAGQWPSTDGFWFGNGNELASVLKDFF